MRPLPHSLARFLCDETGAVTVEYVALAAAVTGVGMAASDTLRGGLGYLGTIVASELSGETAGEGAVLYDDAFANGAAGWTDAFGAALPVSDVFGIGTVLGPIVGTPDGQASVQRTFDLGEDVESATISFDLYALDRLEDESGLIYVDGRLVGDLTASAAGLRFEAVEQAGVTVEFDVLDEGVELGGSLVGRPDSLDDRVAVRVTVTDPSETLTFGFGSTADGGPDDESFAIDDFALRTSPKAAPPESAGT